MAAAVLLAHVHAGAQPQQDPQVPPQQPPADPQAQPHQRAEQAMQGGGMTDQRQLDDEQARQHFRVGQSLYDAGRFDEAAHEFEEAFNLSHRAELLFNAYIAFRDANDLGGAVRSLRGYLEGGQEVPDRLNLQARLRSLEEALREQEEAARLAALNAPPPAPTVRPAEVWPWIVTGVGGAIAIAGIFTGVAALSQSSTLARDCPQDAGHNNAFVCPPGYDIASARGSTQALSLTTDLLIFGGSAIALTGFIFAILWGFDQTLPPPATAAMSCGPSGCTGFVQGRF